MTGPLIGLGEGIASEAVSGLVAAEPDAAGDTEGAVVRAGGGALGSPVVASTGASAPSSSLHALEAKARQLTAIEPNTETRIERLRFAVLPDKERLTAPLVIAIPVPFRPPAKPRRHGASRRGPGSADGGATDPVHRRPQWCRVGPVTHGDSRP